MRLSTCAARICSPPRGARSAGESHAPEGLASWHTADRAGVGHSAASHVLSRSFEAPVRDGVRVLAARVDGPIGKAGQVAQRSGMTGAAGMGGGSGAGCQPRRSADARARMLTCGWLCSIHGAQLVGN